MRGVVVSDQIKRQINGEIVHDGNCIDLMRWYYMKCVRPAHEISGHQNQPSDRCQIVIYPAFNPQLPDGVGQFRVSQ